MALFFLKSHLFLVSYISLFLNFHIENLFLVIQYILTKIFPSLCPHRSFHSPCPSNPIPSFFVSSGKKANKNKQTYHNRTKQTEKTKLRKSTRRTLTHSEKHTHTHKHAHTLRDNGFTYKDLFLVLV